MPYVLLRFSFSFLMDCVLERERETLICCYPYLCIHWLILVCALTRDQTCNLGILGQCSNQLSYLAGAISFWKSYMVWHWDCFNGLNMVTFSSPFPPAPALVCFVQVSPTQALGRTGLTCLLTLSLFSVVCKWLGLMPGLAGTALLLITCWPAFSLFFLVTAWILELPSDPQTKAQGDTWTLEGTQSGSIVPKEGLRQNGVLSLSP